MSIGPHVYGDGRRGVWFIHASWFTEKLRDRLPKLSPLGVTDVFLPREATLADKKLVQDAGYFSALYETPPAGKTAAVYAAQALADVDRLKMGALELNVEGVADDKLAQYVRDTVKAIRAKKPLLRLRINVVPWKGAYLPADLFASDSQLFLIVQNFLGNMDARVAENELVRDAVEHGVPAEKVSVMYGAHIAWKPEGVRLPALPEIRFRGSIFSDDLLADAGYLS